MSTYTSHLLRKPVMTKRTVFPADTRPVPAAPLPVHAILLRPGEGEVFNIIGGHVRILTDGAATSGRLCVIEAVIPPGEGPPLHRHEREDELFYIVDGKFKFAVNGREFTAGRGTFACAPRGSVHAFRNIGSTPGRLHVTCTPAGIEKPFRAVRLPEPGSSIAPLTMEQIAAEFARHGITFHGPPLQ